MLLTDEVAMIKNKTIRWLFEDQVKRSPNAIAVVCDDQQLTYLELNEQSNQLARLILKQYEGNVPTDTLIVLCLDRSLEMMIGLLGILKAGAAYVPVDPNYPAARIQFILEDTQAQLVLTQTPYAARFKQCLVLDKKPGCCV